MPGERKPGQDHSYYEWSPVHQTREPLRWPNGARVALVVDRQPGTLGLAAAGRGPRMPLKGRSGRTSPSSNRKRGLRQPGGRLPHPAHPRQARDQADDCDGQGHRRDQPVPGGGNARSGISR